MEKKRGKLQFRKAPLGVPFFTCCPKKGEYGLSSIFGMTEACQKLACEILNAWKGAVLAFFTLFPSRFLEVKELLRFGCFLASSLLKKCFAVFEALRYGVFLLGMVGMVFTKKNPYLDI